MSGNTPKIRGFGSWFGRWQGVLFVKRTGRGLWEEYYIKFNEALLY